MSQLEVADYTYLDWVVDSVFAEFSSSSMKHEYLEDEDGVTVAFYVADLDFALTAGWTARRGPRQLVWSLFIGTGPSAKLIQVIEGIGPLKGNPFDSKKLINNPQSIYNYLVDEAGKVGRAAGKVLRDFLLTQPSTRTSEADSKQEKLLLRFNAYSAQLDAVEVLGENFFEKYISEACELLPGLRFLGILSGESAYRAFLELGFEFKGVPYFSTAMHSISVDDRGKKIKSVASEVSIINSKNQLSQENRGNNNQLISPGYFETPSGLSGEKLRKHRVLALVNSIAKDQGLERIYYPVSPKKAVVDKSVGGFDDPQKIVKLKLTGFKSSEEILQLELDELLVFPIGNDQISIGSRLESVVPVAVLEHFHWNSRDMVWAKNVVKHVVESTWITWESHKSQISKFSNQASGIALEAFSDKYPLFDSVTSKFEKKGSDPGSSAPGTAIGWTVVLAIAALVFSAPYLILPGLIWIPAAMQYRKSRFRPAFVASALRSKKSQLVDQFAVVIRQEFKTQIEALVAKAFGATPEDWEASVSGKWKPLAPRPLTPARDLTPQEAEHFTAQYLMYFGLEGVQTTRFSRDGGVDVSSKHLLVQVKHQVAPVGVKVVREMLGVASSEGKIAGVFSKAGYTREAIEFGEQSGVLLFSYIPDLKGHTKLSRQIQGEGFSELLKKRDQ